jgi:peptidoglycan/xylan/chitin deacetylase (PgdA/CDA1 family)
MLRVATPPTFASAPAAPALILMYHRVDEDVNDPFRIIVHPKRFREHLRRLGGLADVVPLNELVPLGRGPRPRVAITFDDGYIDNLEQAVPELERAGAPATVFAISDLLGSPDECWWDQLEYMFRCGWEGTRAISLDLRGQNLAGELSSHL